MVQVTYADLHALLNKTVAEISAVNAEKVLDMAVDCLNLYGQLDMSNMGGAAGAKTLNVTSQQRAAVMLVARAIYYAFYVGLSNVTSSPISISRPADLFGSSVVLKSVHEAAKLLQEPDFSQAFLR